jgi:hypothetical protein
MLRSALYIHPMAPIVARVGSCIVWYDSLVGISSPAVMTVVALQALTGYAYTWKCQITITYPNIVTK